MENVSLNSNCVFHNILLQKGITFQQDSGLFPLRPIIMMFFTPTELCIQ